VFSTLVRHGAILNALGSADFGAIRADRNMGNVTLGSANDDAFSLSA
jgi:hypothetical protein